MIFRWILLCVVIFLSGCPRTGVKQAVPVGDDRDQFTDERLNSILAAAERGTGAAQYILGFLYYTGGPERGLNYMEADSWLPTIEVQARSLGMALYQTGDRQGPEVPLDFKKAEKWLRKSSEPRNGFSYGPAQFLRGLLYLNGQGVPRDYREAKRWFEGAAMKDVTEAQYMLGVMHVMGMEGTEDSVDAYRWLALAASSPLKWSRGKTLRQNAAELSDIVAKEISPLQAREARQDVDEWNNERESRRQRREGMAAKNPEEVQYYRRKWDRNRNKNTSPPKLIKRIEPVYPEAAGIGGLQGRTILTVDIDEAGNIGKITAAKGRPELVDAAVAAVRQWKYSPAVVDDKPVGAKTTVMFHFQ